MTTKDDAATAASKIKRIYHECSVELQRRPDGVMAEHLDGECLWCSLAGRIAELVSHLHIFYIFES